MFSDEEFTTFSNKVANIKDKEKVRELAEDYADGFLQRGKIRGRTVRRNGRTLA